MRIRKAVVALSISAVAVASAGAAFAYWTTSGAGSGSATSASANGVVTLAASFAGGITPGATENVAITAGNAGTSNLYVGTVTLASVTVDAAHGGCGVADFTMPDVVSNTVIPAGASATSVGTGSLSFANTGANQDACKGAIVTLHLTSN